MTASSLDPVDAQSPEASAAESFALAVVVPARNEEETIQSLLEQLTSQTFAPREIVIVDAGSTDRTAEIAESFAARGAVKVVRFGPAYPGVARNAGVRASTSPWIVFLDAGVHITPHWLACLVRAWSRRPEASVVFSDWEPMQDTFFRRCYFLAIGYRREEVDEQRVFQHGAFMVVKRTMWEAAGGYPPYRASEDRQFAMALKRLPGITMIYAPEAVALWEGPRTLREAFSKWFLYGYHDILAGRSRDWQTPVLRIYLIIAAFAIAAGLVGGPLWAIGTAIGLTAYRILKRVVQKWRDWRGPLLEWPAAFPWSAVILVTSDLAAVMSLVKVFVVHDLLRRPSPYDSRG